MPELPEVETTLRGIAPRLRGALIDRLLVRERRLRYPVPADTENRIRGQRIQALSRRGKYLLLGLERGTILIHLGMSGSLRVLESAIPPAKHDHLDLCLCGGSSLRLRDPRRFGIFLWTPDPPADHPLLAHLGPEPLDQGFDGDYLYAHASNRTCAVKSFVMDAQTVVGVGNIYANESLFLAGIHPARPSNRIGRERYRRLATAIRRVLASAIDQGGTTLRDFVREDGRPGYFALSLKVYGRTGDPCPGCGAPIRQRRIGQRSSFFCPRCQT
ncbi:MAG: bifunctional DNA-formamidopyrimidine glycosylase/DNA-(apurinic or apyrimidinic site) lyase [Chromatiaceae bacterium]|jgi:formamidopyrimidine-DNA glycosylase|nr:bifunctional DNA-formamidopyrimidine glycosylase/DNA-(apurinic or apyrimidinic site) lyase [Chromatiaceae bacterium]